MPRLLVVLVGPVAVAAGELVALRPTQVGLHHLRYQAIEADLRFPAEPGASLGRIPQQRLDFGRAEVARVDAHDGLAFLERRPLAARAGDAADLGLVLAVPLDLDAELARRGGEELAYVALLAGGDDVIVGRGLLQDHPLRTHEIARM